jgi:hypothetical protein
MAAQLSIAAHGDKISVTLPGTDFTIAYRKSADLPHLELVNSWLALEPFTSREVTKFRLQALGAAIEKARELGWLT